MKPGCKRLLVFILCLFGILLVNSFFLNILSGYKMCLFLLVLLSFFHFYFVFEKARSRYLPDILFEVFIFITSFFILYYLLGIIIGLARVPNNYNFHTIFMVLLPLGLYSILREIFRYNMLCKMENKKICTIIVIVLFILLDLTGSIYTASFHSQYDVVRFLSLTILPTISMNISYSLISKKVGYTPIIIFDLIMVLFPYLIPIIPNPNEYVISVIHLVVPVLFALRIDRFFNRLKDDHVPRDYRKKKCRGMIIPVVIILFLVYLYSGYFRYYAVAIGSGSMRPKINKGDIVIINQKDRSYDIGDVIAYKQKEYIIVHRIINKVTVDNVNYYYTKGDANNNADGIVLDDKMIIGKVKYDIPYIGYPTVWLGEI